MPDGIVRIRSALFTPGTEAARLRKAVQAGADICIFDLEDSVPPARIEEARQTVRQALAELGPSARTWVRVHAASSDAMRADLVQLPWRGVRGIVLPKVDDAGGVEACRAAIATAGGPPDLPLMPIIESARGVLHCEAIAHALGVACLALGRFDLAADIGINSELRTPALAAARAIVVLASAAARLNPPLDSPWLKIHDLGGLRAAAEQGRQDGFGGMLLIHPSHVEPVNRIFSPTAEEVAWARAILAQAGAADAGGKGAFASDGQMVDEAIVRRARAILRDAEG